MRYLLEAYDLSTDEWYVPAGVESREFLCDAVRDAKLLLAQPINNGELETRIITLPF